MCGNAWSCMMRGHACSCVQLRPRPSTKYLTEKGTRESKGLGKEKVPTSCHILNIIQKGSQPPNMTLVKSNEKSIRRVYISKTLKCTCIQMPNAKVCSAIFPADCMSLLVRPILEARCHPEPAQGKKNKNMSKQFCKRHVPPVWGPYA